MGWFGDYGPYVSVAEKKAKAVAYTEKLKKKGRVITPVEPIRTKKIATTFWGEAWCTGMESHSAYALRLDRGKTYVRNGSVVDLQITAGKVTSIVAGSEVYEVEIKIDALKPKKWDAIKEQCAGQVGSALELLQGKFDKSVMAILTDKKEGLIPLPGEIKVDCTCPDGVGMCKHVAATLYGVGSRLDTAPDLLFTLRCVNHLELIQQATKVDTSTTNGNAIVPQDELADLFGIELEGATPVVVPEPEAVKAPTKPKKTTVKKAVVKKSATKTATKKKPVAKAKKKAPARASRPPKKG